MLTKRMDQTAAATQAIAVRASALAATRVLAATAPMKATERLSLPTTLCGILWQISLNMWLRLPENMRRWQKCRSSDVLDMHNKAILWTSLRG